MKVCKCTAAFVLASLAFASVSAQTQPGSTPSLSMPKITAPKMPSVSTPSVGGGFYVPGSAGFYTGAAPSAPQGTASSSSAGTGSQDGDQNESTGGTVASSQGAAGASTSSTTALLTAAADSGVLTSALSSGTELSSLLSAGDLNSLASMGSLTNLSSLLGNNASLLSSASSAATANGGRYLTATTTADSKVLQQILSELSLLKEEVGAQKSLNAAYRRNLSKGPRILRFLAGGTDILSTCREVFFSTRESDGTFLLTGDRTYTSASEAAPRTETFYLLFKATGCTAGKTTYTVTPSLSQSKADTSSALSFLSSASSFSASRTGNLVTLRGKAGETQVDLLLSLDD